MYPCIVCFQFGQHFSDLWNLFQPKLSEPQISMHHNKQVNIHICTPANPQLFSG